MRSFSRLFHFSFSLLLVLAVFTTIDVMAVPAKPGAITVKQADGSEITIKVYGDEHFNWRTTIDGYPIVEKEGFYYYATYSADGVVKALPQRVTSSTGRQNAPAVGAVRQDVGAIASSVASSRRAAKVAESPIAKAKYPCTGVIRSAVILVEYADVKFSVDNPHQAFSNMLNQKDYSVEGATGSAADYFAACSGGQFEGQFDVYGPYTLPNKRSYYGANDYYGGDAYPDGMIVDAVTMAHDDGADFSQYDLDGDNYIDNVFVYYAGHNEAEGGPASSIWPHKWSVNSRPIFDGKYLYTYACTSELRGQSGTTIAGIGTFCHEFSHVFGLADHYDTNGYTDGGSLGMGYFDLMDSGSYNNNGNTPPIHNALEQSMIGWSEPTVVTASEVVTLKPINEQQSYRINTDVKDEYFLIEYRDKNNVWDSYLMDHGVMITHVDRSRSQMWRWDQNNPNGNTSHECFKIVPSNGEELSADYRWRDILYPSNGANNEWSPSSTPEAKSWSGEHLDFMITQIENMDGYATMLINPVINIDVEVKPIDLPKTLAIGDRIAFEVILTPSEGLNGVRWSSSDESIAVVDEFGVVTIVNGGKSAYITATSIDYPLCSDSYALRTEQRGVGVVGSIFNGDRDPIANAEVVLTNADMKEYKSTSDENGRFTILDLKNGEYTITAAVDGYVTYESTMSVEGTVAYLDLLILKDDEFVVEPGQVDAFVRWNLDGYKYFNLTYKSEYSSTVASVVGNRSVELSSLLPGTEYELSVEASADGYKYYDIYQTTFTTIARNTLVPMVIAPEHEYKAGDEIQLKAINTTSADKVSWEFNSESVEAGVVELKSGMNIVKCRVSRGEKRYNVIKLINAK